MRAYNLKRYGLTTEQYDALLEAQEFRCALCRRHKDEFARGYALAVDHDHETGAVRGLVCYRCNLTLARGLEYFERGVAYLKPFDTKLQRYLTEIDKSGNVVYN